MVFCLFFNSFEQRSGHMRWDKARDVAIKSGDFFDQRGADEEVLFFGHEEDRLYIWGEVPVHGGHFEFILEIGDTAQATKDGVALLCGGEVDEETIERFHSNRLSWEGLPDHVDPFFDGEQWGFADIDGQRDDDLIEQIQTAFDDADVAVGQGVETTCIDGSSHRSCPGAIYREQVWA